MIEVEGLRKSFGSVRALDGVSFKVDNGEIVGLVGLNGAGKTTTMRIIVGVLRPDSGRALIDGHDVLREKVEASRRVGWVPEAPAFEGGFTAKDYLVYLAGYYGIPAGEARRLANELLDEVGLSDVKDRSVRGLSLGMRKRFALAASMISDPGNFLFDEVLNGLDPQGIAFFRDFALKLKRESRAVLFSSHILSEVQSVADRVVFLHRGKVVTVKSMQEILAEARTAVRVVIANPDDKVMGLLSKFGEVVRVGQNAFEVKGASPEDVNSELVRGGYRVSSVTQVGGLEEYFFRVIGGEAG